MLECMGGGRSKTGECSILVHLLKLRQDEVTGFPLLKALQNAQPTHEVPFFLEASTSQINREVLAHTTQRA